MKTILVIDDEAECLIGIEEILKRFGYDVIAVQNGQSALSVVKQGTSLDLVITDYQIDEMDGLELLTSIRQLVPSVPSIMLTGHASIEMYLKALNLGICAFLNKPVGAKEIGRCVKAVLEKAELESGQSGRLGTDVHAA